MPNGPQATPLSKILARRAKQRLPAQAVTYAPITTGVGIVKSVDGVLPDGIGDVLLSPYDLLPAAPTQTDVVAMQIADRAYTDTKVAPKADKTTTISAGAGLTGGGDLSANRSLAVSYGTIAGTACQGNDARLSNARTPSAHASTHASAGSDPVTLSQSQVTNLTTDLAAKAALISPAFADIPTAPTAVNGTNTTQIATTAFVLANAVSKALVAYVDNFTTPGANVWTKRTGFVYGYRIGIGGGGGGGSGRKGAASSARPGGAPGCPAGVNEGYFSSSDVGGTEIVTIGAGGNGGVSQTSNNSDGNKGSDGIDTTMTGTATFVCSGGQGGFGGANPQTFFTNGIAPSTRPISPVTIPNGASSNMVVPSNTSFCGTGAPGGGITNANALQTWSISIIYSPSLGNVGMFGTGYSGRNSGGACAASDGLSGANGSDSPIVGPWGGGGGGGGYASLLGNAGNGGNGGRYGASGGGGGAAVNAVGNSGAGGNGAQGMMQVISYCLE